MEHENRRRFRFLIKTVRFWKRFRDWFAAALDVNTDRKVQLYVDLFRSSTSRDLVYWLQLVFSAGIATMGLVTNSSAVIIGAMLISPLMGPILSAGLALATGDLILAIRAGANILLSTFGAILFAVILVALLPFKDETAEITARTSPTVLELVIALFSGAVGSVAICRDVKGVATSIPGVAIAVALMPPLCVVGYGLGVAVSFIAVGLNPKEGFAIARGGGLLYLTNLVAITFTAMLVFVMLRIDTAKVREKVDLWRSTDRETRFWQDIFGRIPQLERARKIRSFSFRLLMVLLPLLLIIVPLSQSFSKFRNDIIQKQADNQVAQKVREVWEVYEEDSEGNIRGYLDELRIRDEEGKINVFMRVFDNVPYTQKERDEFIRRLAKKLGRKPETLSLQLIEIPTSERDKISPVIQATPTPLTVVQSQAVFLQEISNSLASFSLPEPAVLINYNIITGSERKTGLQINYLSDRDIDADGKRLLLKDLRRRLNMPGLSLTFTRVIAAKRNIEFERNSTEFTEDSIAQMASAAMALQRFPALRLRIMLATAEDDDKLTEDRGNAVRQFFARDYSLDEKRLAVTNTGDSDLADTYQVFLRK